jgi:hypothetical protein
VSSWLTTVQVRAILGNISQQRVSQLVRDDILIADKDDEGRLKYDRESVEQYAALRAIKKSSSAQEAEERKLRQVEARERFKRERERVARLEAERRNELDELQRRGVKALEEIAKCLSRKS